MTTWLEWVQEHQPGALPAMTPVIRSEHDEAVELMRLVRAHEQRWPCLAFFYHQDNGRSTRAQGARKKAEGVLPGVVDYFLPAPRGGFHGLYLELKARGKKPTAKQTIFLAYICSAGYAGAWADSAEGAWGIVQHYLQGGSATFSLARQDRSAPVTTWIVEGVEVACEDVESHLK